MTASERGLTPERGISRRRVGRGFTYRDPAGVTITDPRVVDRIRHLAVPPAWRHVLISPDPDAPLQAVGIDARGRKQYRYHERFRAAREARKFGRLARFGLALPRIRRRVARDLHGKGAKGSGGLPRDRVLAAMVRLLDLTAVRVGGEAYARQNRSYGLTTLRPQHVRLHGTQVELKFRGKGKRHVHLLVDDPAVAAVLRRCRGVGARHVFVWRRPDGSVRPVRDADVNRYIRRIAGSRHSAKDFRTWAATVAAARALRDGGTLKDSVAMAAQQIGDTPAVTQRSYVHPRVLEALAADEPPRLRPHKRSGQRDGEALAMAVLRWRKPQA